MNPDQLNQLAQETVEKLIAMPDDQCLTEFAPTILRALESAEGKQKLAEAMMNLGLATGHGESLEDLLNELEWQFKELRTELTTLRAKLEQDAKDWAEDDTAIRNLCRTIIGAKNTDGDSYSVPSMVDIVEETLATLRAREKRLGEALELCIAQACTMENGALDSCALSAYAEGLRLLAETGRVNIIEQRGRRVIAEWVPTQTLNGNQNSGG